MPLERLIDRLDVVPIWETLDVPPVRVVPRHDVLAERQVGTAVDRDMVVVITHDQLAKLHVTGNRAGFVRHALMMSPSETRTQVR